jgi:glycosyltransferase involved in cell wall biosynthesis
MLLNSPYPADIRVKKEASALIAAGYDVWLLCLRRKSEPRDEQWEGIHVHRIDAGKNNYALAFWDITMSLFFVHPKFLSAANDLIARHGIAVLHVHDLPLAGTALKLRKKWHTKVVIDFHENYPEALKTWFAWKTNPITRLKNYLFLNPRRWFRLEKRAVEKADRIIAVVDEMKGRLIREHGAAEKIHVVTNAEERSFADQAVDQAVYGSYAGKFILSYTGGLGPHRGIDTAIQGMALLADVPAIEFVIVGSGSTPVTNNLRRLIEVSDLHHVHLLGPKPFSLMYSYMHLADVNVIPHHSNGHTDNTIPHKLFQGMMAGKPLLVSSSAPLKRLVEQYQCGLVFQAGDPADFAKKVLTLYRDPHLRRELGENGRTATLAGRANWEEEQSRLAALYHTL